MYFSLADVYNTKDAFYNVDLPALTICQLKPGYDRKVDEIYMIIGIDRQCGSLQYLMISSSTSPQWIGWGAIRHVFTK